MLIFIRHCEPFGAQDRLREAIQDQILQFSEVHSGLLCRLKPPRNDEILNLMIINDYKLFLYRVHVILI